MIKIKFFLVVIAITAIISGCEKSPEAVVNNISSNPETKSIINFEQIDKISTEIANFHTFAVKKYMNNIYKKGNTINENNFNELNTFIKNEVENYDFKVIDKSNIDSFLFDSSTIQKFIGISDANFDFSVLELNNLVVNFSVIKEKCNQIHNKTYDLILVSGSFDEFKESFNSFVNIQLAGIKTESEYMNIRIFADVYLSSFECWAEYLYSNNSKACGWWESVKKVAKEAWEEVKPMVKADAGGAIGGALIGAAAGGVGAGPGAIGGGCAASIIQGVTQL